MNAKVVQTALLPPIASKRQGCIHATVGHNNIKNKKGHLRTPLRFGKLVGRSTAKRRVIRGQWKI
jgi:hypothetical protein